MPTLVIKGVSQFMAHHDTNATKVECPANRGHQPQPLRHRGLVGALQEPRLPPGTRIHPRTAAFRRWEGAVLGLGNSSESRLQGQPCMGLGRRRMQQPNAAFSRNIRATGRGILALLTERCQLLFPIVLPPSPWGTPVPRACALKPPPCPPQNRYPRTWGSSGCRREPAGSLLGRRSRSS